MIKPMIVVYLRFYEELNKFLPQDLRKRRFGKRLNSGMSVKELIENCDVPSSQVDLILVNGQSVNFDYRMCDGDRVSIYPVFESLDISGVTVLSERPLRNLRFIAEGRLMGLTGKLRALGFDVACDSQATDEELIRKMVDEHRVLLTRNRSLLTCKAVLRGYCVHSDDVLEQLQEIIRRFNL